MTNALKNDTKSIIKKDVKDEREKIEAERDKNDYQLNRAVDMVKALAVYGERFVEKPVVKKQTKPVVNTSKVKSQSSTQKPMVTKPTSTKK